MRQITFRIWRWPDIWFRLRRLRERWPFYVWKPNVQIAPFPAVWRTWWCVGPFVFHWSHGERREYLLEATDEAVRIIRGEVDGNGWVKMSQGPPGRGNWLVLFASGTYGVLAYGPGFEWSDDVTHWNEFQIDPPQNRLR